MKISLGKKIISAEIHTDVKALPAFMQILFGKEDSKNG